MADIGFGTTITFGSFTGEMIDQEGPELSRDAVETTHYTSTDGIRTRIPGLIDPGEITLSVNFDPNETPPIDGDVGTVTITWPLPDGDATPANWACDGFVTKYKPTAPIDDRMTAEITIQLTGPSVYTASA